MASLRHPCREPSRPEPSGPAWGPAAGCGDPRPDWAKPPGLAVPASVPEEPETRARSDDLAASADQGASGEADHVDPSPKPTCFMLHYPIGVRLDIYTYICITIGWTNPSQTARLGRIEPPRPGGISARRAASLRRRGVCRVIRRDAAGCEAAQGFWRCRRPRADRGPQT